MKISHYLNLVKEWHPTLNGKLSPTEVTRGSGKKIWWKCPKGHEYQASPGKRTRIPSPTGCPYCAGNKASRENNLSAKFPEIASEWHPTKNGKLTPDKVTSGSNKKVWWKCALNHAYDMSISNRTIFGRKGQCPYCSGKRANKDNSLRNKFPDIASQWDLEKNGTLTPDKVTAGSSKKIWWRCAKKHSYIAPVVRRTGENSGCPYCSGRFSTSENNLLKKFPNVAKEWHPTKNGKKRPEEFLSASNKKVWWLCQKGHAYDATIAHRTLDSRGCPRCSRQSSEPEIRILTELMTLFLKTKSRFKVGKTEIDIYIPEIKLGIEYDGCFFHKDKQKKDKAKSEFLESKGISVIRVREVPLKPLSELDIVVSPNELKKTDLNELIKKIVPYLKNGEKSKTARYLRRKTFANESIFREYLSYFPSPFPEDSLMNTHPELAREWDYIKNTPLTPHNFSYGCGSKFWWKCAKNHSWLATINNRTNHGRGCPYCSGRKASKENNLLERFPEIASEWHPTKNGKLTPDKITSGTHKKVWWRCPEKHVYDMPVVARTGVNRKGGCPYCAGQKVNDQNSLYALFPNVVKEWHPTKNLHLDPRKVTSRSGRKAWWQCRKGHEFEQRIADRTDKRKPHGCPFCAIEKRKGAQR